MSKKKLNSNRKYELTNNQKLYFDAICEHIKNYHTFPTRCDLAAEVGVTANAVQEMICRLEKKGFVECWKTENKHKSYRISNCVLTLKFSRSAKQKPAKTC
jgi:DNA-binding transcriptional regulator YhcF (GntR family)